MLLFHALPLQNLTKIFKKCFHDDHLLPLKEEDLQPSTLRGHTVTIEPVILNDKLEDNEQVKNIYERIQGVIMMVGVEIDLVVTDSLKALELYENIFEIERIEVSDLPKGTNEAVFTLYGVRFHMLDENPEFQLVAPTKDDPKTIWFNVSVPDIKETYAKAMSLGCTEIQAVTDLPDYGVSNAMFMDSFGYVWMLHQIHKVVSHEERIRIWEEKRNQ